VAITLTSVIAAWTAHLHGTAAQANLDECAQCDVTMLWIDSLNINPKTGDNNWTWEAVSSISSKVSPVAVDPVHTAMQTALLNTAYALLVAAGTALTPAQFTAVVVVTQSFSNPPVR
jgi:hypothetical protein